MITVRSRPLVVAFDIIETVFSLEKLRSRLVSVGLPPGGLEVWFAQILRDAFALEVTGVYQPFREIALATLSGLFAEHGDETDPTRAASVLDGFAELDAHPDANGALRRLCEARVRIVALTNGSAKVTEKLLQNARLNRYVERLISIDEIRHWKPRCDIYLHAARCAGVEPRQLALIAAHAWDIHGAGLAGLTTAFVARGKPFPATMVPPHLSAGTLTEVAELLVNLPSDS